MVVTRKLFVLAVGLSTAAVLAVPGAAVAHPKHHGTYPTVFSLPDGFLPEGITIPEHGSVAYFGSRADGDIYRADLATGEGTVISQGPGTASVGLKIDDRGRLFVAGGNAGTARVVSARTGEILASYQLTTGPAFINDVVLTREGAYFTNSQGPTLYFLPIGRHGKLPAAATAIPITGGWVQGTGNNANGLTDSPDGKALLVIQSNTGFLWRVDKKTGVATRVDLGPTELLTNGDGLLLLGRTLYVVQNRLNQVAKVSLNRGGTAGTVLERVTDPNFDVPTTVAAFGKRLYLPNARFTSPQEPTTTFTVVAIPRF